MLLERTAPAPRSLEVMGTGEFLAAAVCVLVNLLDGFDVLIVSAAAGSIGQGLALSTAQLGLMFSVGLGGMMLGALVLAPLADRIGRRPVILGCLLINAVGMFATGLAASLAALLLFRFVTGLGVGGLLPTINTAVAEVVHPRRRDRAVLIQCAAYPAGGLLASVLWSALSPQHSWQVIFQLASVPSWVCFGLVWVWLPETEAFLSGRVSAGVSGSIRDRTGASRAGWLRWGGSGLIRRNLLALTAATFLAQFAFYFFINWLPPVMAKSMAQGHGRRAAGAILLNLGGIAGNFVFAGLSTKVPMRLLGPATMVVAFISIGALGWALDSGLLTAITAALVGAALFGQMASIYAFAPIVFPVANRAAGTGIAFSVGRLGGVVSPSLGAWLLSSPVTVQTTLLLMASPLLAAGLALRCLRGASSGEEAS